MATRLRLVSLLAAVLLAAVVGVGSFLATGSSDKASAGIVAGEFSLETTAAAVVPLGSNVTVGVRNDHDGAISYQAAQWKIDYPQTFMDFVSAAKDAAAPAQCASISDNGDALSLGCLDTTGPNLTYSGNAFNAVFQCYDQASDGVDNDLDTIIDNEPYILPNVAVWALVESTGATAKTFVKIGTTAQTIHVHSGSTACVPTADISTTKTADAFVVAGGVVNNTVVSTNNGPQNWTAAVVVDDMPEPGGDYTIPPLGTVDIDVNGDTVPDIAGAPCVPGYLPASAVDTDGDTVPDVIQANVMACIADLLVPGLSIAPGGSITLTHQYQTTADSCNRTLIDVGMGVSLDTGFAGPVVEIVDPDFLDGIDFPPGGDDNFAIGITQVGDCQVTLAKTGPGAGAVGDSSSYSISVTNAGPSAATNLTVTDNVDPALTVTSATATGGGDCTATVGNAVSCSWASLAAGSETITINFDMVTPGLVCNSADATWTRFPSGSAASNETCFTMIPPYNGIVKGVDTDGDTVIDLTPAQGQDTILVNLWLCVDQATDGIDNDGNSTVDDELPTCTNTGEGDLDIGELIFSSADCDTRNDDDDGDGLPVDATDGSGINVARPECPQPTLADYNLGLVDKDGGELPEGLGAFEFQLKFDHKIFDITITEAGSDGVDNNNDNLGGADLIDNNGDTVIDEVGEDLVDEPAESAWLTNGRVANCTMTIITENDIRFGCVSTGTGLGFGQVSGVLGATIHVAPEADLYFRIRPTKDNGVVRRLLDENCEIADIYGDIFPNTNAGLTNDCTDIDITIRKLEGDVNSDCNVDVEDAQLIAFRYGSFFGHLVYDLNYDLEPWPTADFDIDIKDLQFVFGRDGSSCADPIPSQQLPQAASGVGQP